jgi:hypothetical protein
MLATSFKKTEQSKQSASGQKFAQSGHPASQLHTLPEMFLILMYVLTLMKS